MQVASYSKLSRTPFGLNTNRNDANAAAIFLHIFSVRAGPSSSGYVHINQRGFKVVSRTAFHQPSCVKYSRALRRDPSSKFVKCAPRRRAAPRSQFVEAAASRRRPALRIVLQSSYIRGTAVVRVARNTVALQASGRPSRQRSNPSVELRANGMAHWPSSAGPAAHFALAVQRATPLALSSTEGLDRCRDVRAGA